MADFATLSRRLNLIAESNGVGFVELARSVGLDPARDFQHADLSGVDLRGQNCRGFNFKGARLDQARIHGATFDPALSRVQLSSAVQLGRGVAVFIGPMFEDIGASLKAALEPSVTVPDSIRVSLQEVGKERERHYRATQGPFLDGGQGISRLIGGPFRKNERVLKAAKVAIILFQPTADFDFDTFAVVRSRLQKLAITPVTFVFPAFMEGEAGRKLYEVRAQSFFQDTSDVVVFDRGSSSVAKTSEAQGSNVRYLQHLVDWITVSDGARKVRGGVRRDEHYRANNSPHLRSGVLQKRGSLINALREQIGNGSDLAGYFGPHHLFLSETTAASADLDAVATYLASAKSQGTISVFPDHPELVERYYLLSAPSKSALWRLV